MLKVGLLLLALASVQAAEPAPLKNSIDWGQLGEGFLLGLQYNPNYASGCIRDFNLAVEDAGDVAS